MHLTSTRTFQIWCLSIHYQAAPFYYFVLTSPQTSYLLLNFFAVKSFWLITSWSLRSADHSTIKCVPLFIDLITHIVGTIERQAAKYVLKELIQKSLLWQKRRNKNLFFLKSWAKRLVYWSYYTKNQTGVNLNSDWSCCHRHGILWEIQ